MDIKSSISTQNLNDNKNTSQETGLERIWYEKYLDILVL